MYDTDEREILSHKTKGKVYNLFMKKLFVLLCLGMLTVGMTACGNKEEKENQSVEQSADGQAENSDTTGEENGGAITEPASTEETTEGTSEYMDVTAGWSEEMEGLKQAVVSVLGDNYWPETQIYPEILESNFGISPDMYDDYMGEMPMISTHVDTMIIIKAKEDKADEVEKALNEYHQRMIDDTMQYPMNVGKIQAGHVEKIGNYVCYVQLGGDTTQASDTGDEAVIQQCTEQNDLALATITENLPQ